LAVHGAFVSALRRLPGLLEATKSKGSL
jgi:hypothetical protein